MITHDVEQLSPEWFDLHNQGIPTSSRFDALITSTGKLPSSLTPFAIELSKQILEPGNGNGFTGNKSTERGQALEPEAIDYYELVTGNQVDKVGFMTDDLIRYGASTDGLINKDGLLEVKCLELAGHIKALDYFNEYESAPLDRVPQLQGELLVTERQWADLLFYYPDPKIRSIIITVQPDFQYQETLKSQINAVITERNRIVRLATNGA